LTAPAGTPASWQMSASRVAVTRLCSAGFMITVQPNARAGATFQAMVSNGSFHGAMAAMTPSGSRTVYVSVFVSGRG
jgi:hypothetical protein